MTIEKAFHTHGFMDTTELTYLAQLAEMSISIAEIGTWMGRSARALADNTNGMVHCFDTWSDDAYGDAPAEMTGTKDWLWNEFRKNHEDTLKSRKVWAYRMPSVDGAALCRAEGITFDLIFIDAGHNYEDVVADICNWRPLLRPRGVMCGHDLYPDGPYHPGVLQAVKELVSEYRVIGTIWSTEGL